MIFLFYFSSCFQILWSDLLLVIPIASFWIAAKHFQSFVELTEIGAENTWNVVKQQYLHLYDVSKACNRLVGSLFALYILETIVDISSLLFDQDGWSISGVSFMIFDATLAFAKFCTYIVAADIPKRVNTHCWFEIL